jgi:hypothetical protein
LGSLHQLALERGMSEGYFKTRLEADARRDVVWKALWESFFSKRIDPSDAVLDIGTGWGSFINQVKARRRIAVDEWSGIREHVGAGVEVVVGDATDLGFLEDRSIDFAFASNLLEHLTREDCTKLVVGLKPKLTSKGTLNLVQPNFRYCAPHYFDDFTHVTVFSHVSLCDFLEANGYEIVDCRPRFLPLTVKSRMPTWSALVKAYLVSPIKPLAGQMYVSARVRG